MIIRVFTGLLMIICLLNFLCSPWAIAAAADKPPEHDWNDPVYKAYSKVKSTFTSARGNLSDFAILQEKIGFLKNTPSEANKACLKEFEKKFAEMKSKAPTKRAGNQKEEKYSRLLTNYDNWIYRLKRGQEYDAKLLKIDTSYKGYIDFRDGYKKDKLGEF